MAIYLPPTLEAKAEFQTLLLASSRPSLEGQDEDITCPLAFMDGMLGIHCLVASEERFDHNDALGMLYEVASELVTTRLIAKPGAERIWTGACVLSACLPAGVSWNSPLDSRWVERGRWLGEAPTSGDMGPSARGLGAAILGQCGAEALALAITRIQRLGVLFARRVGATFTLRDLSPVAPPKVPHRCSPARMDRSIARGVVDALQRTKDAIPKHSWFGRMLASKGKASNALQMRCSLGVQLVDGVVAAPSPMVAPPHATVTAQQRAFVKSSFMGGLTPAEFYIHSMAGRVGVVHTAMSTADTGYLSRCLVRMLESLRVEPIHGAVMDTQGLVLLDSPDVPGTMVGVATAQVLGASSTQNALDSFHSSGTSAAFSGINGVLELVNARSSQIRFSGTTRRVVQRRPLSTFLVSRPERADILQKVYAQLADTKSAECELFEIESSFIAAKAVVALRQQVSDVDIVRHRRIILVRVLHSRRDPATAAAERRRIVERCLQTLVGDFTSCGREQGGKTSWGVIDKHTSGSDRAMMDACGRDIGATPLSPVDVCAQFGIAAARSCVETQLRALFPPGNNIPAKSRARRILHLRLTSAAMCRCGSVHGATRDGMAKAGGSALSLMNFESPRNVIVQSALSRTPIATDVDPSACVMWGRRVKGGTGGIDLFEDERMAVEQLLTRCPPVVPLGRRRKARENRNQNRKRTASGDKKEGQEAPFMPSFIPEMLPPPIMEPSGPPPPVTPPNTPPNTPPHRQLTTPTTPPNTPPDLFCPTTPPNTPPDLFCPTTPPTTPPNMLLNPPPKESESESETDSDWEKLEGSDGEVLYVNREDGEVWFGEGRPSAISICSDSAFSIDTEPSPKRMRPLPLLS